MATSVHNAISNPGPLETFVMVNKVRRYCDSREEARAVVDVINRTGALCTPEESDKMYAESKAGGAAPTIDVKAAACAAMAAQYGLGAFDWTAIIKMLLSLLPMCGL